jgi:hypothetical protein
VITFPAEFFQLDMKYEKLHRIIYLHRLFTLVCSEAVVYTGIQIKSPSYSGSSCNFPLEKHHIILIVVVHQVQFDLLYVCLITLIFEGYET